MSSDFVDSPMQATAACMGHPGLMSYLVRNTTARSRRPARRRRSNYYLRFEDAG
jgi:hypothetical protein